MKDAKLDNLLNEIRNLCSGTKRTASRKRVAKSPQDHAELVGRKWIVYYYVFNPDVLIGNADDGIARLSNVVKMVERNGKRFASLVEQEFPKFKMFEKSAFDFVNGGHRIKMEGTFGRELTREEVAMIESICSKSQTLFEE